MTPPTAIALVVIDMQQQFTTPGAPFVVDGAADLVQRVSSAVSHARSNRVPIIWVSQHVRPAVGLGRTSRRYGTSTIHQGDLATLDRRLDIGDDIVIEKHRQSAFYGTDLETVLRSLNIDTVVLAGVTTNVCVLATAIDAGARDLGVIVARDLTAALPVRHDKATLMTADEVQRAAEAFVIHAVGDVMDSFDIPGLGP